MAIAGLKLADLVREVCHDIGAGPLALGGAVTGYRAFAGAVGAEADFPYAILGIDHPGEWETGTGRIDGSGRLERVPGASSAEGAAVDFSSGEKHVLLTPDALWLDAIDRHGHGIDEISGLEAALAGRQPASSELGAIAGLSGTGYGRGVLTMANATALRAYIGAGTSSAGGTVTSVALNGGTTGLSATGGPITNTGTIVLGGTLALTSGGTGATSAGAARSNLGLGTAATQDVGTSGASVPLLSTGNLWGAAQTFPAIYLNSAAGTARAMWFYTGATPRWAVYSAGDAESGGNSGSTLAVSRYGDDGGSIGLGLAMAIDRATGDTSFEGAVKPFGDNGRSLGTAGNRWSVVYAGTGAINTSDAREKQDISPASDALLDAWAGISWTVFRFRDACAAKGENARWHCGAIAQQVRDTIDAALGEGTAVRFGLVCHDQWAARPEQREGDGRVLQPSVAAGDRWGLRYEECFALEAAYQRRRMDRFEAAIAGGGDAAG